VDKSVTNSRGGVGFFLSSSDAALVRQWSSRAGSGLQISSVLNGAGAELEELVRTSTHPDVANRWESVTDFLELLDDVEREMHTPEHEVVEDPTEAQQGDILPGGLTVVRRLGKGSTSVALLVKKDEAHLILKAAVDPEHNPRLRDEAEILQKLRHQHIVDFHDTANIGEHLGVLVQPTFSDKEKLRIDTLGDRLRKEGRLHIDLLQRFGDDLIGTVIYLEEQGIPHRDIKPDNIAVGMVGHGKKLHLVLFDFSLSRAPAENIRAGTKGYLDPLLPLRKRWDLQAERYAVAMTLHELATGTLPQWGDGRTDPSHLTCEVSVDPELFDANLREGFTAFFRQALRRDVDKRFDNSEDMLRAWRGAFEGIAESGSPSTPEDEEALLERLGHATPETAIHELGLGMRATNALDRMNVITVNDLLKISLGSLQRQPGVGNKTRTEIKFATRALRKRLGAAIEEEPLSIATTTETGEETGDVATMSVDLLFARASRTGSKSGENTRAALQALLGLDPELDDSWPSQIDVSRRVDVTRARIGQLLGKFQDSWKKQPSITCLRDDLAEALELAGGVMTSTEMAEAVLASRGSVQEEPQRTKLANAIVRVAVEVERTMQNLRFIFRRADGLVLLALNNDLAEYAIRLGKAADKLAEKDPLVPPVRAVEQLQSIKAPGEGAPLALTDARLVRLAAAASQGAAVSSRQELYPKGMDAGRALKLAQGALLGIQKLTVDQIAERLHSRYPEAARLPERPKLDDLLAETGFELQWDASERGGRGAYVNRLAMTTSFTHTTDSLRRRATISGMTDAQEFSPEIADARQFEERLQRGVKEGAFFALLVNPKHYDEAMEELQKRFPVELMDFEGLFIDALRETADAAKVDWELVLHTDATPGNGDWDKLMLLVRRAMPLVEKRLLAAEKTILLIYPGLIARYGQMDLIERLRDKVGRQDGIPGLWMLIPGDSMAVIEGQALPILAPGQRTKIPTSWLENVHRTNAAKVETT
jgi:serine/threonine protein kinase